MGDKLKKLTVEIGEADPIIIVTNAKNVEEGVNVVVAQVGSIIGDPDDGVKVKKASVGGIASQGMLCDFGMLGWKGGAKNVAATVPDSFEPGSRPPSTRPRVI